MKKYTLAVTSPEYWSEIHDALIVDSNQDGIPDRQVTCSDSKEHSPTRGTYELTDAEAVEIANHSHIKWIELSPTDNPDNYPKPQPATKRFRSNVKIYRDLNGGNQPPTSSPTTAEIDRTNWAVKRVGIHSNGDFWPVTSYTGNIAALNGDTSYSLTGKNVDLVIHDSGVMQYHPEFIDGNGKSRVRDIVLDGPYYIDPDYFNSNNYTYVKMDGRIGITTTSAHNWWENSSLRSAAFSSAGTVWISSNYTVNRSMGDVGTTNALTSGHGTGAAGVSAGNNFGLAFEANIWNMPGISDNVSMGIEANYDLMKIFHKYKPINAETGVKNPTLVNGSWGHQAGFASNDTVSYKFRGSTGTFTGNDSVTNQVTAWKDGFNNQIVGAYKSWSSSSRSNSTDTAGNEMIAEGVIYVAAAGNNNQRMGIGRSDPDRLNYMEDEHYNVGDPRSEFPGLACPSNHRDWMNPQGIGFDEANDYHPVICVGCVDEYVDPSTKQERKADYSNNGPGIDIWGFGDEALSAGLSGDSSYEDFPRYSSSGPTYYDCLYNGTSSAAPTIAGLIALYLETNPKADSRDVKYWLNNHASRIVDDGEYQDVQSDDTTTAYWTGGYNMRGAEKRLPIDPYASDVKPSFSIGAPENIITDQLVLNLDAANYTYTGGYNYWYDSSGQGGPNVNLPAPGNSTCPTYNSGDGGYFEFDGSNDRGIFNAGSTFGFGTGQFTFEMWVDTYHDGAWGWYFTSKNSGGTTRVMIGAAGSTEKFSFDGFSTLAANPTFPINSWSGWKHYVVTREGTGTNQYKLYINGELIGSETNTTDFASDGTSGYLGSWDTQEYIKAKLSSFRVYKGKALTASEVKHNYDVIKHRFEPSNTLKITSKLTNITTPLKGASIAPTTWSAGTEAQNNEWTGVAYGNGKFVAVSRTGFNRVMTSTDGINWTSHNASNNSNPWYDVHYSSVHNRFVAVAAGNANTNRIMYSSNGTSWTSASLQDENSFTCYNNSIASGSGANGKFVIVGAGGVDRIRWSNDGTVWNTGSASENSGWRSVAYGNGYFVAVAVTGTNRVMRSTSGTSWTSITNTGSGNDFVGHYSTAYGNGTFVTVSASATNKVKYSTNNGSTWTGVNMGSMTVGSVITFIEDTSGTGYFMIRSTNLLYSTDGINWTEVTMSSGPQSRAVTNGDDLAVSVGGGGAFYYNMRENTYDSPSTLKLFYK